MLGSMQLIQQQPQQPTMVLGEACRKALAPVVESWLRIRRCARSASSAGSSCPAMIASNINRPDAANHVTDHRAKLHVGVFQYLLDAVRDTAHLIDQLRPLPRQIAQFPLRPRRE